MFGLSIADARVTNFADGDGERGTFFSSDAWVVVPPGTVDFLALSGGRLVCASTSAGLGPVAPL